MPANDDRPHHNPEEPAMSSASPMVTGVDFVSLPTKDLAAAREFYGTVLGLEASSVYQRGSEPPFGAEFETGNLTLSLLAIAALGVDRQPSTGTVALHVADVAAARAELESRGVTFLGETMDTGVCHVAQFTDPDGNALMLHHRYAPRTG
jgi:predicted enzyme related to lactoylglutathione lyase